MADAATAPLIVIVGGDSLALQVCDELAEFELQEIAVLWPVADESFLTHLDRIGARYVRGKPSDEAALRRAGVENAFSILLLTNDDHLNLETALKARDANPAIRVVMSQFNRTLGAKIEAKLPNCAVISLAAQSAATYASAAVDHACFYGVQFPDFTGPLFGFAQRSVARSGTSGMTLDEAEAYLEERIVAVDGDLAEDRTVVLRGGTTLATFGRVRPKGGIAKHDGILRPTGGPAAARFARSVARTIVRTDPLIRTIALAALAVVVSASIYFSRALAVDPVTGVYFVMSTMTTTGYGDIVPHAADRVQQIVAMAVMVSGVVFTAIFVAILTTEFTKTQWTLQQGLRKISRRGHVVVCGAGNVGTRVIDFLTALDRQVIVIEPKPRSTIVERSRDHEFDLLTGDATAESTLALCNLAEAESLVVLTESDTTNLEVALSAKEINSRLPVVLRMVEQTFARSVAQYFGLHRAFGTAGLAAPVIAGLSRVSGVRGFVTISGHELGVIEIEPGGEAEDAVAGRVPLVAWRDGAGVTISAFSQTRPGDRVLTLYPVYKHRKAGPPTSERRSETHAGMAVPTRGTEPHAPGVATTRALVTSEDTS